MGERQERWSYEDLVHAARDERHAFQAILDPDDPTVSQPTRDDGRDRRLLRGAASAVARRRWRLHARDPREPGPQVPAGARCARGSQRADIPDDPARGRRFKERAACPVHRRRHGQGRCSRARPKRPRSATSPYRWSRPARSAHSATLVPSSSGRFLPDRYEPRPITPRGLRRRPAPQLSGVTTITGGVESRSPGCTNGDRCCNDAGTFVFWGVTR